MFDWGRRATSRSQWEGGGRSGDRRRISYNVLGVCEVRGEAEHLSERSETHIQSYTLYATFLLISKPHLDIFKGMMNDIFQARKDIQLTH